MITIEALYNNIAKNPDELRLQVIKFLDQALHDWPDTPDSIEKFSIQLQEVLGVSNISQEILQAHLTQLDPKQHAWELESMSCLISAFKKSETSNLVELTKFLAQEYK